MPENLQTTGVRAIWEGSAFLRGYRLHIQMLKQVDQEQKNLAKQTKTSMQRSSKAVKQFSDQTKKSLKQSEDSTRSFIKSISGIYAVFRLAPQIASDFGEALREAAAGQVIRESFEKLADSSGVVATALVRNMQRASRGTIAEVELMRIANRAMLAGGEEFARALPRLFQIARAAATATGKELRFVFDTLVTGIARSSIKLIDNAEIYLKVGQVVDAYAKSIGKSADELSAQEKQIIVLNAVLEQGADIVKNVGSEVEVATDQFDRYDAIIIDAKQHTLEFINEALGPLGPLLKTAADQLLVISPLLQTIALLKLAGAGGLVILLGKAFIVLAGGIFVYEQGIRRLAKLPFLADLLGLGPGEELPHLTDAIADLVEGATLLEGAISPARQELALFLNTLQGGVGDYERYIEKVNELNASLIDYEAAIRLVNREQFELGQILLQGVQGFDAQIEGWEAIRDKASQLPGVFGNVAESMVETQIATMEATHAQEEAIKRQEEGLKILERAKILREGLIDLLEKEADQRKDIVDEMQKVKQQLLDLDEDRVKDAAKSARKVRDLELDSIRDRAKAYREFNRDIRDAERQRNLEITRLRRQHQMQLEDIEHNHRRRMMEIEENFQRSVREAAIERDTLGIIQARERRGDEIRDATRDREDAIRTENRSFAESLRQAEENFQERIIRARQALQDELEDIAIALAERLAKERQAFVDRMGDLDSENVTERQKLLNHYAQLEQDLRASLIRRRLLRSRLFDRRDPRTPGGLGSPGGPTTGARHGFDGVVTGPHTFQVESGVTEYVHMGGDLGRQSVLPSAAQTQAQSLRANVAGAVGVGLSGFNEGLLEKVGPQLRDMIGQAVIDEFTAALTGGTR